MSAVNPITGDDIKTKIGDIKKYRDGFDKIKPRNCGKEKRTYECDDCNCWLKGRVKPEEEL